MNMVLTESNRFAGAIGEVCRPKRPDDCIMKLEMEALNALLTEAVMMESQKHLLDQTDKFVLRVSVLYILNKIPRKVDKILIGDTLFKRLNLLNNDSEPIVWNMKNINNFFHNKYTEFGLEWENIFDQSFENREQID